MAGSVRAIRLGTVVPLLPGGGWLLDRRHATRSTALSRPVGVQGGEAGRQLAEERSRVHHVAMMRKVAVIGIGGAGKTTLANQLGEILQLPVVHLDHYYWSPGWNPTPDTQWRAVQEDLVKGDDWIIEGNYGATLDIRLSAADTVVFLDFHPLIALYRATRRSLRHHGRAVQAEGCPERIDPQFMLWIWRYRHRSRPRALAALGRCPANAQVEVLSSPTQVRAFLHRVRASHEGPRALPDPVGHLGWFRRVT